MKISIIADEISQDPHAAVYIGSQMWNVNQYELRMIEGKRVPDIDDRQVAQLEVIKEKYDIVYSAIGAGLFKCEPDDSAIERQFERLDKAIQLAKRLDVRTITGFALQDAQTHRSKEFRDKMVPHFQKVCKRIQGEGLQFAVETEYMTGVETARDARELIDQVPGLKINWDPANAWVAGEHPLEGYPLIRDCIANVHCKDADSKAWRERNPFVAFGDGLVPWDEIIPLLLRDSSVQTLTVETHIGPLIPKSEKSVRRLRALIQSIKNNQLTIEKGGAQ
ncbi:sugar phosphate isomerase/epimerase family protein [Paenibacillus thalictri]|uniref:Sugar phosphate isomerase/epimerase n=1 Tax=Paenibacillus thalictri TaxID=2527873 RepID=A0A4Q9DZL8_9BACL|nr:sugar phosphate isomerase/epimerase family protein [Paenibacillus thalictri]TBL81955.1 sugar phosphate isomerase/epimerase [Paenibacillus thalictri]